MRKQILLILMSVYSALCTAQQYLVGAGMYDITGPAAEVGMLGYGKLDQLSAGLHLRQRARAFIIADKLSPEQRIVLVVADLPMLTQSIHHGVLKKLKLKFGEKYSARNVMLSATHTHSAPGAYAFHTLYNITSLGFSRQNYDNIVDGIVQAIERADANLEPGKIMLGRSELTDASKNRSLESYQKNASDDTLPYAHPFDTQMVLFEFISNTKKALASINWFPLHAVSMSNQNHLISSDNKGVAELLLEKYYQVNYHQLKTYVAAFAQANEGDVSPNIDGSKDDPLGHDFIRTYNAGEKQFKAALKALTGARQEISGKIDARMIYLDMSNQVLEQGKTCVGSLGYAFAAGTDDGKGVDWFKQGDKKHKPFIDFLTSMIAKPSAELTDCQMPKPILLPTGMTKPYHWSPAVVPVQLLQVGHVYIAAVPGEFTTVSGRRLKKTLAQRLQTTSENIIISGLSNSYSGYVTTPEEYDVQRYEGGHTLFGKWTLNAYLNAFEQLANDLLNGVPSQSTAKPDDLSKHTFSFITPVLFDDVPLGKKYGENYLSPKKTYDRGETVTVGFWGAHPRNDLMTQKSFLEVQQLVQGQWQPIVYDWDFSTKFFWKRVGAAYSKVKVEWHIDQNVLPGAYRIVYHGHRKQAFTGKVKAFTGVSPTFKVGGI